VEGIFIDITGVFSHSPHLVSQKHTQYAVTPCCKRFTRHDVAMRGRLCAFLCVVQKSFKMSLIKV